MKARSTYNSEWVEDDSKLPEDLHTANTMIAMANSIRPTIQFTADVGSNYENGRVPILDMAMKIMREHLGKIMEPVFHWRQEEHGEKCKITGYDE